MSPVLLDPCNPPRGVMLQWRDTSATSGWNHRAYWGDKPWDCGGDGPACRRMGNLPPLGQWVRLEVAARSVGFNGNQLYGVGFDVLDGRAWFDRTGTEVCSMPVAAAPEIPADETVWFDDALPAGACPWGTWQWDTAQKASGTQSHTQPSALGREDRYFQCATPMSVATGDKLVSWVLTNPCDPPRELMLAFNDNTGKWTYVYWGENMFGAPGQVRIGDLPPGGRWVRLEVPVATVGLGGRSIVGMEFLAYDGKVWWDRSGKVVGATASSSPDSVEETAEHAPHATTVAAEEKSAKAAMHHRPMSQLWERIKGRFRQGSKPEPEYPPVGLAVTARYASQGTATNDLRRYSLYSPELQLLAETNATPLQPWVAQEYIWFNGEPLAQVTVSSGEVAYYFNDHLGAPLLQTDATGAVVWRVERDPYGERYATPVGADRHQPLGLPGQEYDASSDRQYNIFRWYRAGWGRYTQPDPLGPGGSGFFEPDGLSRFMAPDAAARERSLRENSGVSHPALVRMSSGRGRQPQGLSDATNLYQYAAGSPVMFADVLGLAPCLTYSINPEPDYTWIGPKGQTIKGCQYIGKCGPNNLFSIYNDPDVVPGCKCRDFCLLNIDYATGIPIGPSICFDMPPSWSWFFPLISK